MKQLILRLTGIGIYLILVLWLLDFNIGLLFDGKSIFLVLAGTFLLTAGSYRNNMTLTELREAAMWNSTIAGLFTTFMLLFTTLYQNTAYSDLLPALALCMRPLFYTFAIQALCKPLAQKPEKQPEESRKTPDYSALTLDEVKYLLRDHELTDRELEIALAIWKNLSIKEIADKLCISESTVKKHSTSLYKKLQVENREQLKLYLNTLFHNA